MTLPLGNWSIHLSTDPFPKSLQDWILQLPGVSQNTHRFGGIEYRFQGMEFMHSHGPAHLDIRLSMDDQRRVLETGQAEPHRFAPETGWVTLRIRSERDTERAKELIIIAYRNAERQTTAHQARRKL
ncbi:MAG TPA: luciferase family protein [Candidatus Binatus sp.]|nr:luciferase family protein [Candidatus Binatus sp.]